MEPPVPPIQTERTEHKKLNGLALILKLVCFFMPLAGLIIFAAMRKNNTYAARQALLFSVVGIVAGIFLNVIYNILKHL